ncbi:MAG: hypothetical protein JNL87_04170 [Burkholderiaceae bacterium]|nr:hypothetical protein [Burkholderiaceae bacterium]
MAIKTVLRIDSIGQRRVLSFLFPSCGDASAEEFGLGVGVIGDRVSGTRGTGIVAQLPLDPGHFGRRANGLQRVAACRQ